MTFSWIQNTLIGGLEGLATTLSAPSVVGGKVKGLFGEKRNKVAPERSGTRPDGSAAPCPAGDSPAADSPAGGGVGDGGAAAEKAEEAKAKGLQKVIEGVKWAFKPFLKCEGTDEDDEQGWLSAKSQNRLKQQGSSEGECLIRLPFDKPCTFCGTPRPRWSRATRMV